MVNHSDDPDKDDPDKYVTWKHIWVLRKFLQELESRKIVNYFTDSVLDSIAAKFVADLPRICRNHSLDKGEDFKQSFKKYLQGTLTNYISAHFRTKAKHGEYSEYKFWQQQSKARKQSDSSLQDCDWFQLNKKERQVIKYKLANMTYEEIAQKLDITEENARQLYSRAVRKLREQFKEPVIIEGIDVSGLSINEAVFDFGSSDSLKVLNLETGEIRRL